MFTPELIKQKIDDAEKGVVGSFQQLRDMLEREFFQDKELIRLGVAGFYYTYCPPIKCTEYSQG